MYYRRVGEVCFGSLGLEVQDLIEPAVVIQLGVAPNRVDLLTSIDGVEFETAWASRVLKSTWWPTRPHLGALKIWSMWRC